MPGVAAAGRAGGAAGVSIVLDGCDACGPHVTAYVFADMPDGLELSYCGHCGARFMDGLRAAGAEILDLRYAIE